MSTIILTLCRVSLSPLRYRGPVIWNFVNRLVKVPESFYSFKQILRKHVKTIDNFSFEKEATVVANRKDHFIYF